MYSEMLLGFGFAPIRDFSKIYAINQSILVTELLLGVVPSRQRKRHCQAAGQPRLTQLRHGTQSYRRRPTSESHHQRHQNELDSTSVSGGLRPSRRLPVAPSSSAGRATANSKGFNGRRHCVDNIFTGGFGLLEPAREGGALAADLRRQPGRYSVTVSSLSIGRRLLRNAICRWNVLKYFANND